jgi:DNA modification methylase
MSKVTSGYIALNWNDIVSGKKINNSEHPSQYSWLPIYNKTLNELGFYLWSQRIWKKPHARVSAPWSASSNRNVTDWEYLFTWSNGQQRSNARQNDSHFGVIDSSESSQGDTLKDHPGAFPVFIAERMITIHTDHEHSVIDPFGGTGTTLIACEKTNRKCFMMEIDPHYCDVIIARWEKYTGQKAERMNNGNG